MQTGWRLVPGGGGFERHGLVTTVAFCFAVIRCSDVQTGGARQWLRTRNTLRLADLKSSA